MRENTENRNSYRQELQKEGSRKKGIIVLLIGLLVLLFGLIIGGGFLLAGDKMKEKAYFEYIEEADKYLMEMNYAGAELSYLKAIEQAPDRVEAYSGLSTIYVQQGRLEEAQSLLARGIQATNSDALFHTYEQLIVKLTNSSQEVVAVAAQTADVDELSKNLTIDVSMFDMAASYTYTDYVQHCGQLIEKDGNGAGGCDLKFQGFAGVLSYYNVEDDYFVYDAQSGLPYATRKPNEIYFKNIGDIFGNYQGAASFSKLQEIFGNGIMIETLEDGESFRLVITYHKCRLYIECDADGTIRGTPENKLVPLSEDESGTENEEGNLVSGYVVNVMNGGSVAAKLRFIHGAQNGTVEKETEAKFDGSFEVRLPEGQYTVEISAAGFITVYEQLEVKNYVDVTGLQYTLSPGLAEGEIRIVLTWGASPSDLDSHLDGTSSDGRGISIDYRHMKTDGVANLDLDDRSSYGPETTTIYDAGGRYTFSVHDFTNGNNSGSTQLASSGATVKIYLPNGTSYTYTVPAGSGTWWEVCRIENGVVTPVNTIR